MEKAPNITVHGGELSNNEHSAEAVGLRPPWRVGAAASQAPTAGTATTHKAGLPEPCTWAALPQKAFSGGLT